MRVVKGLYDRNWSEEDVGQLFRLIDWMMDLPDELEEQFHRDMSQFEEEKKMPFVTYAERRGIKRGLIEGIEFGLDLKFGQAGHKLFPKIRAVEDVELLRALKRTIKKAKTLDEI